MSRAWTKGISPHSGQEVEIAYGHDFVPGFRPGLFLQAYSKDPVDIYDDPSGEGLVLNEGFIDGLSWDKFWELCKEWQVDLKPEDL